MSEKYNFDNIDFKAVCENFFDGIYVSDGTGKTIYVNNSYAKNLGVSREEVVGVSVDNLEGNIYKGSVTNQVIKSKGRVDSMGELLKTNTKVLVTGIPVFDDDGQLKMVVISNRNITELVKLRDEIIDLQNTLEIKSEEARYLIDKDIHHKKIIYESSAMDELLETVESVSATNATVLITGETGTGKELIANRIYEKSSRRNKPFIKINCAAIPKHLVESELFGYEPGSFTGASLKGKKGLFELANEGTLLLDEIGELPIDIQAKLLRVLQENEILRVGGIKPIPVDVRLITVTNLDLKKEITKGNFREDLFYRLNVIPIFIPPLRYRKKDIAPLARHFLSQYNNKYNKKISLTSDFIDTLMKYDWPGNIRELENIIERIVITNKNNQIDIDFAKNILSMEKNINNDIEKDKYREMTYQEAFEKFERKVITNALSSNTSLRNAAKALEISPGNVSKKCKKYNINLWDYLIKK